MFVLQAFFIVMWVTFGQLHAEWKVATLQHVPQKTSKAAKVDTQPTLEVWNQRLLKAAQQGDFEAATEALDYGADLNCCDAKGRTPLMLASFGGRYRLVRTFLLQKEIKIDVQDKSGMTALLYAVQAGQELVVRLLKKANASVVVRNKKGFDACALAGVLKRRMETIETILACQELVRTDELDKKGLDALLLQATAKGDLDLATDAIDRGASINVGNQEGATPLMLAAARGNLELLKVFFRQNEILIDAQDAQGMTALMYAVRANQGSVVDFLLSQGADAKLVTKEGKTAIGIARDMQNPKMARKLSGAVLVKDS